MYKLNLSSAELHTLHQRQKKERDAKILRRLQCISLKGVGSSHQDIARFLHVTPDTITDWLSIYETGGIDALCTLHYEGRRPSKLDAHREEIRAHVRAGKASKLAELQHYISATWSIGIEQSWLSRYCKKNSILPTRRLA